MSVENSRHDREGGVATPADQRAVDRLQILLPLRIVEEKTGRLLGRLHDLSAKGCRLAGPEHFTIGETVKAVFNLERAIPGSGILTLTMNARWSRESPDLKTQGLTETGFEFLKPTVEDVAALEGFMGRSTFLGEWLKRNS